MRFGQKYFFFGGANLRQFWSSVIIFRNTSKNNEKLRVVLKNHCFYHVKTVEARIEAGLNEPRWSLDGIWNVAKTIVFTLQKPSRPVPRRGSMSLDGTSMAYEML